MKVFLKPVDGFVWKTFERPAPEHKYGCGSCDIRFESHEPVETVRCPRCNRAHEDAPKAKR